MNYKFAESDMEKANMLNSYFALQSMVNDKINPLPKTSSPQHQLLLLQNISVQDVTDVLENLDISKACGPDLISPRLLKEGSSILARPFSFIFKSSLEQEIFPTPWKDSNITPIHKKDDKSMPPNFKGWSGGAMVLGKLPVLGRPTVLQFG